MLNYKILCGFFGKTTGWQEVIGTPQNLIYLFLCDRYKNFMHIVWKLYLLAFKWSTSHFGAYHTARKILIFVNLVRSHFSRSKNYTKSAISSTCVKVTKSYTMQNKALFISFQMIGIPFFHFHIYLEIFRFS